MPSFRDDLTLAAAKFQLELIRSEDVVDTATRLVVDGSDNQLVAELAGAEPRRDVITDLLDRALQAEGTEPPSSQEARQIIARHICRSILDGHVSPIEGARSIWHEVVTDPYSASPDLLSFGGLASEWEDHESHRPQYEADIRKAAARYLESTQT